MDVVSLLFLVEGFDFRLGRRDVRVWSLNPLEGFSCKLFFRNSLDPSPVVESVFNVFLEV